MKLRLAFRTLRRSPWYAATAIATIALTIALASTVFAVVDGVLFKPLPYPDPDRLFIVHGSAKAPSRPRVAALAALDVQYLREADGRIGVAAVGRPGTITHPDDAAVRMYSLGVDPHFFDVLGQRPLMGGFQPQDFIEAGANQTVTPAIVSYGFWQRHLGADPAVVGRTVHLIRTSLRIVGVLPRDFVVPAQGVPAPPEVLVPLVFPQESAGDRWERRYEAVVRLPREMSPQQGKLTLDKALAVHAGEYPPKDILPGPYVEADLTSLQSSLKYERDLFSAAFAAASLLVLLGAINVAGLVGARARDRESELSIRAALGATGRELAGVVLGETFLIALLGGAVGVAIAGPLLAGIVAMLPQWLTLLKAPRIDGRVITFATLAATLPVIACALVPVMSAIRRTARQRIAATTSETSRMQWSRRVLLATESAIGIVLVVAGSLVLAGFALLRADDSGFDESRLAVVELIPTESLTPSARDAAEARALDRLRQLPGVNMVATMDVPLLEASYAGSAFAAPRGAKRLWASEVHVSSGFFDVTGLRALDGRLLSDEELGLPRTLAVVSENLARAYWPNERAVGQTLESSLEGAPPAVTIVGVVKDLRLGSQKDRMHGEIYLPAGLGGHLLKIYLLKTATPDETARRAALAIRTDVKGFVVRRAESLETALSKSVRQERLQAMLFGIAGGAGLLLLAVGIGGLAAMGAARRVREMGIRSALGARSAQLVGMMVFEHLRPSLAGVAIGLLASWWTTRLVSAYLYEVDVHEPVVWVAATATLVLVAAIGGWLPAQRAARVDPMIVLRAE